MSESACLPPPASNGDGLPPPPAKPRPKGGRDDDGEQFRLFFVALWRWHAHTPRPERLNLRPGAPYSELTETINTAIAARAAREAIASAAWEVTP